MKVKFDDPENGHLITCFAQMNDNIHEVASELHEVQLLLRRLCSVLAPAASADEHTLHSVELYAKKPM